jgi:hypothetical protein
VNAPSQLLASPYAIAEPNGHHVYSPGTETITTFLPAHSLLALYVCGRPHCVGSESVIGTQLVNMLATANVGRSREDVLKLDIRGKFVANVKRSHVYVWLRGIALVLLGLVVGW